MGDWGIGEIGKGGGDSLMTWFGIVARGSPDITHASVASVTRLRRQKKNVINSVRAAVLHGYHADTLMSISSRVLMLHVL